jgi:hypothetical protein
VETTTTPAPKKKPKNRRSPSRGKTAPSQPEQNGLEDRRLFDRVDYITYRLFLYALALIGMYAVIRESIR